MAEFKRLSDVDVVAEPTESANVLIEENGVIKKAPKNAVGGAGGTSGGEVLDLYLTINGAPSESTISITDGSFDTLLTKYNSGELVNIRIDLKDSHGCSTNLRPTMSVYGGMMLFAFVRIYTPNNLGTSYIVAEKNTLVFTNSGTFVQYISGTL